MNHKQLICHTKILCFLDMHCSFLLGNNFLHNYLSIQIHLNFNALTLKKELVNRENFTVGPCDMP